jgi:RimJ/RimL family protein N-acetyltransferase
MELVDVYSDLNAIPFLYELLRQRDIDTVSLSHRVMPTVEDHIEFYRSKPYRWWYIIMADGERVGTIYLTPRDEIGIDIRNFGKRKGYGSWAVQELMRRHHSDKFLANINPKNTASLEMFRSVGFVDFQVTLRYSVAQSKD